MIYTENILNLKKSVPNYRDESTKWLFNTLRNYNKKNFKVGLDKMKIGSFYFMKYDSQKINKSSRLEQIVPMMIVDYKPSIDKKVMWILNLNFLPLNIKEAFFSKFLKKYDRILEENSTVDTWDLEKPLSNVSYQSVWSALISFGLEYAIREIRLELVNELTCISTDNLHYLTSVNTQILTRVDENKLNEIWVSKLKSENIEERVDDLIKIKSNYEAIIKELAENFKALDAKLKK